MRSDPVLNRLPVAELEKVRALARDASLRVAKWRGTRVGVRGLLLYLLALPLLPAAIAQLARGDVPAALGAGGAFALIVVGARLNRRGMLEQRVAGDRRFTRASRIPFQHLGLLAVAFGTFLAALYATTHGLAASVLFAGLAGAGMLLVYRIPAWHAMRSHLPKRIADTTVRDAVFEAEKRLLAIERSALQIGNAELESHLLRIVDEGGAILAELAERPGELHRARRFLNVHLEGAERVAVAYARAHRIRRGGILETKFRSVLVQIEAAFRQQRRQLLERNMDDLDIQIDVLRKQLQREGIA